MFSYKVICCAKKIGSKYHNKNPHFNACVMKGCYYNLKLFMVSSPPDSPELSKDEKQQEKTD